MSQSRLQQHVQGVASRPSRFNIIERIRDAVTGLADDLGVPLDYFTRRGDALDDDTGVIRWQYSTVYEYPTDHPEDADSSQDYDVGTVQFRTELYTLTDPSREVKSFLRDTVHDRLKTLFNTKTYDGYMDGFSFIAASVNEESGRVVGRDEVPATGLGVPNHSVEVYDEDGDLAGFARTYSMDFGVEDTQVVEGDPPEQEVWKVRSYNEPRGDYEVSPEPNSPARERAKNMNGKTAYVNGMPVGSVTSRGTFWLTKEHSRPALATYQSRADVLSATSTPYQALSPGANLYKVRETPDGVYFSTVEPSGFDPSSPGDVDVRDTGLVREESLAAMDEDEASTFVVTHDQSQPWALGKYTPPVVRDITREADYTIHLT
jgi:hypothetical protein